VAGHPGYLTHNYALAAIPLLVPAFLARPLVCQRTRCCGAFLRHWLYA